MHVFHFRPGKSALASLLVGGAGLMALWFWWVASDGWISLLIGLLCLTGSVKLLADVMSGTPALVVSPAGLRLRKTWGAVVEVPWTEVQHVAVEVFTLRYFGIIPISRQENLVLRCDGGLFGARRVRLALNMVEMPPGGVGALMDLLHRFHVAAVGEAGVAMAGAGEHGWGSRSVPSLSGADPRPGGEQPGFDPDAALARYLSRKEEGRGAPVPAALMPAAPARPSFGRKRQAG
jgi:hypothetical protein